MFENSPGNFVDIKVENVGIEIQNDGVKSENVGIKTENEGVEFKNGGVGSSIVAEAQSELPFRSGALRLPKWKRCRRSWSSSA